MAQATPEGQSHIRHWLRAGFGTAMLMLAIAALRHPVGEIRRLVLVGLGLITLLALGAYSGRAAYWTTPLARTSARRWGLRAGLLFGLLWCCEISFNNLVDPAISTGEARFVVDNSIWAGISLGTVIIAALAALQQQRVQAGIVAGVWSGLVSGLCACLAGLTLIVFGMRFLTRDPLNIAEYAALGATSGSGDIATYFTYETMAGSLGHLFLIGIAFGAILGALGGVFGRGLALGQKRLTRLAR